MKTVEIISRSEKETIAIGEKIACSLKNGAKVFIMGDLGTGKTQLTKGIVKGLGIKKTVKSPTYTLLNHYKEGGREVIHFDYYRLRGDEILDVLHTEDIQNKKNTYYIFEWPERLILDHIQPDIVIRIKRISENHREIQISESK